MGLGHIFSSLAGGLLADAGERGLAAHANRRKPGDPSPTSVHSGPIVLALTTISCVAFCIAFGFLIFHSIRLGEPVFSVWLLVASGGLASWSLFALWDAVARRIDWNAASVRFRRWNGERIVSWDDIVGVEEKPHPPHMRIAFRDGKGFAITETMNGSRNFLRLVESRLAPETPDDVNGSKRRRRRQRRKKR